MHGPSEQAGGRYPRLVRLAGDWRLQLVLVVAALGLAVATGVAIARRSPGRRDTLAAQDLLPEARPIWESWLAAAAGDVDAYLACFTHEAREELDGRLARAGREALSQEVRAAAEAALSIEWGPPEPSGDGALRLPATVQRETEAERLDYLVVKAGERWKIRSVEQRGREAASPPYAERLGRLAGQGGER